MEQQDLDFMKDSLNQALKLIGSSINTHIKHGNGAESIQLSNLTYLRKLVGRIVVKFPTSGKGCIRPQHVHSVYASNLKKFHSELVACGNQDTIDFFIKCTKQFNNYESNFDEVVSDIEDTEKVDRIFNIFSETEKCIACVAWLLKKNN